MGEIRVRAIQSKKDVDKFIKFPFQLYRGNPYWVPPLISERRVFFDPQKNPFFEHAEVQLFLAERDGEAVGTIAAIINDTHNQAYGERTAFWGIFEAIEEYEVAEKLFSTARDWAQARGMDRLRGPMNLAFHHEFGLLVDAFDMSPVILTTYNPPYYPDFVERFGFEKVKDHYAYYIDLTPYHDSSDFPKRLLRVVEYARKRSGVTIRQPNFGDLEAEVTRLYDVFNSAWRNNWGATPVSQNEAIHLIRQLKPFLDKDYVYIAEKDGKPVGVSLSIIDYNQALLHMNGQLFPFGWLKFLFYRRQIKVLRVFMMGVIEEYRTQGLDSVFYFETAKVAVAKRLDGAEMSLILEDNDMMRRIIENFGGVIYKTYRLYDLPLAGANKTA